MKHNKLIDLNDRSGFNVANIYLEAIKNDFQRIKDGFIRITVLDYYIWYRLYVENSYDIKSLACKYAFTKNILSESGHGDIYTMLPVSFYEMEYSWAVAKDELMNITMADVDQIRMDKDAQLFRSKMEDYIVNNTQNNGEKIDQNQIFREVRASFRRAFIENQNDNVRISFKKIIKLFYAETFIIDPISGILNNLKNGHISIRDTLNKFGIESLLPYDENIFNRYLSALRVSRDKLHSDIVDALCFSQCHELNRNHKNVFVNFATSTAVFNAYFLTKKIREVSPFFVRNITMASLEKFILETNNNDLEKSIKFLDHWIEQSDKIVKNWRNHKYDEEKNQFRSVFAVQYKISVENFAGESNGLWRSILLSENPIDMLTEDRYMIFCLNDVNKIFEWTDCVDTRTLDERRSVVKKDLEELFTLFYKIISEDDYLKDHMEKYKVEIEDMLNISTQDNYEDNMLIFRESMEQHIISDGKDWAKSTRHFIENALADDNIRNDFIIIFKEYYYKAKNEDKLVAANIFKKIMDKYDIHY